MNTIKKLYILILVAVVASPGLVIASEPALLEIKVQPASITSVDFSLSQQPVLLVKNANGDPVPGIVVTVFKASGSGLLKGNLTANTDQNGLAKFANLQYTKTDDFSLVFIYSGGSPVFSSNLRLSAGAVSVSNSSVLLGSINAIADGQSSIAVNIALVDKYGNKISGLSPTLSATGSNNNFVQPQATDVNGQTIGTVYSTKAEQKTISVLAGGVLLSSGATVSFAPGEIAKLIVLVDSPITTVQQSQIDITAQDQYGNVATNDSSTDMVLSVDNGGSLSSALVTLKNGLASSSVSKTTPGSVNLTVTGAGISVAGHVIFEAVPAPIEQTVQIVQNTNSNPEIKPLQENQQTEVTVVQGGVESQPKGSVPSNQIQVKDNNSGTLIFTAQKNETKQTSDLFSFGQAGLLGAFKNLSWIKDWVIENYIWIILAIALFALVYLLWFLLWRDNR